MIENIRVALAGLGSNRMRSALTMLGITIGTAAVIILISLGQAVQNYILGQFAGLGSNLVFVSGSMNDFSQPEPLTESDVRALSDIYRVPDALLTVGSLDVIQSQTSATLEVVFEGQSTQSQVTGVTPDYIKAVNIEIAHGRFLDQADLVSSARVAVIGSEAATKLFGELVDPIGQNIRVAGLRFEVIGVLKRIGGISSMGPGGGADGMVLVPLTTAQLRMNSSYTVSGDRAISAIVLKARDSSTVSALVEQVRETLREEHRLVGDDKDDFAIFTQDDLMNTLGSITGLLTIFLGVIAGISLVVGGIGIMNIMLVTVTERTREIGLRKAVGAKRPAILLQFLTEATVLALIGGSIGIGIAVGLALLVSSAVPDLQVSVQMSSITLATLISVAIGVFFGIYPANRAAALNPIDALRYE